MKKTFTTSIIIAIALLLFSTSCDKFLKIVTVKTLDISNLTATTVTLRGQIASDGGGTVTERGFFYSTSKTMKNPVEVACGPGGEGDFEYELSGLQPNTTYYYKAFANSSNDMDAGEVVSFTTYELQITVATQDAEVVSPENVVLKGSYVDNDRLDITKAGFEYSKHGDFSNANTIYAANTETNFTASVALDANSTYYYRAFVETTDSTITVYGESKTIVTTSIAAPELTTLDADPITATNATLHASINADFSGNITSKGFYYSTDASFASKETVWAGAGLGSGNFAYQLTNLTAETTYYFKPFVTYQNGDEQPEVVGEAKSFTTIAAE